MALMKANHWNYFAKYLTAQTIMFPLLILLILINSALTLSIPQVLRWFIDASLENTLDITRNQFILIFLVILSINLAIGFLVIGLTDHIGWNATTRLRLDLLEAMLSNGREHLVEESAGALIERIDGDTLQLTELFSKVLVTILANIIILLGILYLVSIIHWSFGLAFFFLVLITFLFSLFTRSRFVPLFQHERKRVEELISTVEEAVNVREDVMGVGKREYVLNKLKKKENEKFSASMEAVMKSRVVNVALSLMMGLGIVTPYLLGTPLILSSSITVGELFLVAFYGTLIFALIFETVRNIQVLQKAEGSMRRIQEWSASKPTEQFSACALPQNFEKISLNNVTFTYPGATTPILMNMSLEFEQNKAYLIYGKTGSGKTTLTRLILGLIKPTSGFVRLNGDDLNNFDPSEYAEKTLVISQNERLFNSTIRNNLTLFDHTIPLEEIMICLSKLELKSWVESLPNGIESKTAEIKISKSEKQRLLIARALICKPQLLILDESTSSFDYENFLLFENILEEFKEDRIVVIVSHDPKAINIADLAIKLDRGKVLQHDMLNPSERELEVAHK